VELKGQIHDRVDLGWGFKKISEIDFRLVNSVRYCGANVKIKKKLWNSSAITKFSHH
jgi:hypothetical protein